MTAEIIIPDNNSFLVAAKQMRNRGELTEEQYLGMVTRSRLRQ